MKIEGNNLSHIQGQPAERAGQTGTPASGVKAGVTSAAPSTDEVRLSPEIQLIQEAAKVAAAMPDIRKDVVDAMRAELEAGRIGNDPKKTADAMIDSWLNNS